MMKTFIIIVLFFVANMNAFGQSADTASVIHHDDKPHLTAKNFIIPAVFITYGTLTLPSGGLKTLNYSTKNELQEDHPLFNTTIDNYTQYIPAAAVFGMSALGVKGKHNIKDQAVLYAMSMGISGAVVHPIKKLTHQMRPDSSRANSFPSGHTTTAFVAAEFLRKEYGNVSPWYAVGGYLVATGTGVCRMLNNRHWLGDVVAGAGIGMASTQLAYFIHDRIRWKRTSLKNSVITPYYQDGDFGLTFLSF